VRKASRLSDKPAAFLAARPPEAKPLLFLKSEREARGFPHVKGTSRNQYDLPTNRIDEFLRDREAQREVKLRYSKT
jgi:hypothetical protein